MAGVTSRFEIKPGTRLGQYQLESEISNSGNMSWIYQASLINDTTRKVAVKIARPSPQQANVYERLLKKETRMLVDYRHPGIVRIFPIENYGRVIYSGRITALDPDNPPWYFVMELLRGGNFQESTSTLQAMPLLWKLELIYQLAIILDYLHLRELAHRDLKPENIVFRTKISAHEIPQPVLIDFGIAGKRYRAASANAGTLAYADPTLVEELTGEAAQGYITTQMPGRNHTPLDVWALGVIAYELLTGKHPFADIRTLVSTAPLKQAILYKEPRAMPSMPKDLKELIFDMLNKVREKRPAIEYVIQRLETSKSSLPPRVKA